MGVYDEARAWEYEDSNSVKVKFKRFHENAQIPKQATDLAGGWDVVVTEIIQESDNFVICKLGFGLQPPSNYKVTLVPRSSLTKTNWIVQNSPGLGDPDYLLEYQYRFRCIPNGIYSNSPSCNLTYSKFPYVVGDRIGQIYIEEIIPIEFEEVDELTSNSNRVGGFGSTN